ncbi:MAG: hypothetical protein J0G32_02500 [Alphaproteobacteria bacterium]|nr:hypothetical protein [Alphaproteobacteria bacterium]OJV12178.1 MAG: hypothetical protein BGO27_05510 [Alphaproteobacteria bacterium 33-17]
MQFRDSYAIRQFYSINPELKFFQCNDLLDAGYKETELSYLILKNVLYAKILYNFSLKFKEISKANFIKKEALYDMFNKNIDLFNVFMAFSNLIITNVLNTKQCVCFETYSVHLEKFIFHSINQQIHSQNFDNSYTKMLTLAFKEEYEKFINKKVEISFGNHVYQPRSDIHTSNSFTR